MSNTNEEVYLQLLEKVVTTGIKKSDRTGTGTVSIIAPQARYDVSNGRMPLLTTKKVSFKNILTELLWFLNGDTNIKYLTDNNNSIWNEWASPEGDLGPIYSHQWRNFNSQGVDQIKDLIDGLVKDPLGRRHIVSAWNPAQLKDMALPPCHCFFQLLTTPIGESNDFKVSLMLYQRSADMFLGVPYNIASYTILLNLLCIKASTPEQTFFPDELIHNMGDSHVYSNHVDQVSQQLLRVPYPSPEVEYDVTLIKNSDYLKNLPVSVVSLLTYKHHDAIKAPVAV